MNFESILPLLRQGKKIRRSNFGKDQYFYMNNDCIYWANGTPAEQLWLHICEDDWELYQEQETMTFEEAIGHFKAGKTIQRLGWHKSDYMKQGAWSSDFKLSDWDISATDWIIVEE